MVLSEDRHVISISDLNNQAKEVLELLTFWVEGEVVGYKPLDAQRYFYVYFTMQDTQAKAAMSCAMRKDKFVAMNVAIENGQRIIAQGKMSLMTQSGRAVFLISAIESYGQGKLAAEIEKLKQALQAEGLLSDERKRPLPTFPNRIGVVTSVHSDAWVDFKRHSIDKFPHLELVVADSFVQGAKAPNSLVAAIENMQNENVDVLVITRGGGSAEDLGAFSDERVVRAIANSKVPTVVGVGHEKDVSVADLVADVRASTPTNAGQIVIQHYEESVIQLRHNSERLHKQVQRIMEDTYQRVDSTALGLQRVSTKYQALPHFLKGIAVSLERYQVEIVAGNRIHLNALHQRLVDTSRRLIYYNNLRLDGVLRQLNAVSPKNILSRGYSIVRIDGNIIKSAENVSVGNTVNIDLFRGRINGTVSDVEPIDD